jgi:hypothetical protein
MNRRNRTWLTGLLVVCGLVLPGCFSELLNPDFFQVLGAGSSVASLPGEAPGVLVSVQNLTNLWARAQVSYRDGENNVRNFTVELGPGNKTGQMLVCPIDEITLGNVADLKAVGAVVFRGTPDFETNPDNALDVLPRTDVEPFGVLLRSPGNYNCGDGIIFSIRSAPGETKSGYRTRVEIDLAGTNP